MLKPLDERHAELEARFPKWEPRTLDQMLDAAAAEFADRPYVITDDGTYTYADIRDWSIRIANGLCAAGVEPGEHVAVVLANYPEFAALKFGIARAGAVSVPINFLSRRDELGYVLQQSDAVALITMDRFRDLEYLGMLDELMPGWERHAGGDRFPKLRRVLVFSTEDGGGRESATAFEDLAESGRDWRPIDGRDPYANSDIIYTSGTTDSPKGVMITHEMLLRTAYASAFARGFEDGRRITFSLPMFHVFGYVEGMLTVPFVGGAIIPQLVFDPAHTLDGIERHRATDALLVPTMTLDILNALEAGDRTYDLSSLTSVLSSGTASPPGIWPRIQGLLQPEEITTGYGMTETTATTTLTRPDDPIERCRTTNGRMRDVGVAGEAELGGRLVVYRVVDPETGKEQPRGQMGELMARGPGVTSGYYNKPEETAAAFDEEGWLHSGDLGVIGEDDYVTLTGRLKESYRVGGEQVMPREVEDVLLTHPAVAQAYVVPLKDERMGEVGVAWIVAKEGASFEPKELISYCAERLARFKVPKHVRSIAAGEVPTTASRRPRKYLLAKRAAEEIGTRAGA